MANHARRAGGRDPPHIGSGGERCVGLPEIHVVGHVEELGAELQPESLSPRPLEEGAPNRLCGNGVTAAMVDCRLRSAAPKATAPLECRGRMWSNSH